MNAAGSRIAPPASVLATLRVLIVHDWIVAWGGAERTVEQMLEVFPRADLVVGVVGEGRKNLNDITRRASTTWLGSIPSARRHHRWFLPAYALAFASVDTSRYDLIVSSSSAFAKSVRVPRGVPHLCYCHTPPRYLWDLRQAYRARPTVAGGALRLAGPVLRAVDQAGARRVTRFIANSSYVADRIRRAYGRDAAVIYPPVTPKPTTKRDGPRSSTLLSLGRLVPYKRVDIAVQAATQAGLPLIVAGEGPERARLEAMAGPTVRFVGEVSEMVAGELMATCRAMLFCADEDFGITPLEANAQGMPVIAFGKGGARESLVDGVTGLFFDDANPGSLLGAIARARAVNWDECAMHANAARFSPEHFRSQLTSEALALL